MTRTISFLLIIVLGLSSCSKYAKVQKSKDVAYKLEMADKYFDNKKYTYAQQLYEDLFPVFKGSNEFEGLYYKYAYCAYFLKDYFSAENLFKGFIEVFPNSSKVEEMDYMRAYTFYRRSPKPSLDQTNTIKTIGAMQGFINTHPKSSRVKEATEIIDKSRIKLEIKDYKSAELYFNIGHFRAAGIAFTGVLNSYPDSDKADEYKYMVVKSYYQFAEMSVPEKQVERFEQAITEANDFIDRFEESRFKKEIEKYLSQSNSKINQLKNEQTSSSTER